MHANKIAAFLAILRPVLLFVPIVYFLNWTNGLQGIWMAFVLSDSLAAFISFGFVRNYSQKHQNSSITGNRS